MKKIVLLLTVLLCSLAQGQYWENPNQKPSLFGMRINRAHILGDPVGYWLFSEGFASKVYDLSGNGNTGTFGAGAASPIWVPGKFGPALSFDGGDYVDCGGVVHDADNEQITVSAWINTNNITAAQAIAGMKGAPDDSTSGWTFAFRGDVADDPLQFIIWGIAADSSSASGISAGQYYHVAVTYNKIAVNFYINGNFINSVARISEVNPATRNLYLGAYNDRGAAAWQFNGILDLPMIFNRALSASEIALLYREPFCFMRPSWDWLLYGGISAPAVGAPQIIYIN